MNALVSIKDGAPRASSQDVAAAFEKAHKDVLRAVDRLIELAPEISRRNFAPSNFVMRGKTYRAYDMDRDGFSLLAMGFTGPKALQWKLKFIEAFNRMEEALRAVAPANDDDLDIEGRLRTPDGRDAIRAAILMVREMRALHGTPAARALWEKLKLPMPEAEALAAPEPEKDKREFGPLWRWANERGVQPNPVCATDYMTLWSNYFSWSEEHGFRASEPPRFKFGLRNLFGKEAKRGLFALEITRP